jgi:hypothetical protein
MTSDTTYLTKEQILNSRSAYPEGKDSGDPSGKMKEFHDKLCDMALAYLDLTTEEQIKRRHPPITIFTGEHGDD